MIWSFQRVGVAKQSFNQLKARAPDGLWFTERRHPLKPDRSKVDSERAIEVRFRLVSPGLGANHQRQWFLFGFAASVDDEPRYRKAFEEAEHSIRWR
jgi:hypothetical protein